MELHGLGWGRGGAHRATLVYMNKKPKFRDKQASLYFSSCTVRIICLFKVESVY